MEIYEAVDLIKILEEKRKEIEDDISHSLGNVEFCNMSTYNSRSRDIKEYIIKRAKDLSDVIDTIEALQRNYLKG